MKINAFEKVMVNNPIRYALQRRTVDRFAAWKDPARSYARVLEIGCGFGRGMEMIDRSFTPESITAIDLDEDMVTATKARTAGLRAKRELLAADASALPFPDAQFDAVFEMTIFHHIPEWRSAIRETARVLRPGGTFFFEELAREFHFDLPVISYIQRRFTIHPWDSIPDTPTFLSELENAGLHLVQKGPTRLRGWICGAAVKPI